jgi:hypothetical protein
MRSMVGFPLQDWTLLVHPTSYYSRIAEVMFLHFSVERTCLINGQPLVKEYDDPYNKASNSVNIDINPINEQTIKGEVDDSSKVIGDSPLFNRFGSDPDKTKQEVDDSLIVCSLIGLISILTEFEALLSGSSYSVTSG